MIDAGANSTNLHSIVASVYMLTISGSCEASCTGVEASVSRYTCRRYFLQTKRAAETGLGMRWVHLDDRRTR